MGLNELYAVVRDQILLQYPLPPINNVYSLIVQAENQRSIVASLNPIVDNFALAIQSTNNVATQRQTSFSRPPRQPKPQCTPIAEYWAMLSQSAIRNTATHRFTSKTQKFEERPSLMLHTKSGHTITQELVYSKFPLVLE